MGVRLEFPPSLTTTAVDYLCLLEAPPIVIGQVDRQTDKIPRGGAFMLDNLAMIELDRCAGSIEERDLHHVQIVEVHEEFVSIRAHFIDVGVTSIKGFFSTLRLG